MDWTYLVKAFLFTLLFAGTTAQYDGPCNPSVCLNGGTCQVLGTTDRCLCPSDRTGVICQLDFLGRAEVSGEPQYFTFDRDPIGYAFHGTCTHVLSQLCDEGGSHGLEPFRILGENVVESVWQANNKVSILGSAIVVVFGQTIELSHTGGVKVNGAPVVRPWIYMHTPGQAVTITDGPGGWPAVWASFGLRVVFLNAYKCEITLTSSRYAGELCGMLGDLDGNPDNDMKLRDGSLVTDINAFGNDWKDEIFSRPLCIPGGDTGPGCETTEQLTTARRSCLNLNDSPFGDCNALIDTAPFVDSCVYDLCFEPSNGPLFCSHMEKYSTACGRLGFTTDWRATYGYFNDVYQLLGNVCDACGAHAHYDVDISHCPNTCSDPDAEDDCDVSDVINGCECDDGYLLSNGECITPDACGCTMDGSYHLLNESWWIGCGQLCRCISPNTTDCIHIECFWENTECVVLSNGDHRCVCIDGYEGPPNNCTEKPVAVGTYGGEPHFFTFDGKYYDFMGTCHYVTTQLCDGVTGYTYFDVISEHGYLSAGMTASGFTGVIRVLVHVYGHEIVLARSSLVWVDGEPGSSYMDIDGDEAGQYIHIRPNAWGWPVIETDFNLKVQFSDVYWVSVLIPGRLRGKVCGMLGDANDDPDDDFRLRDGTLVSDPEVFGVDWLDEEHSPTGCVESGITDACASTAERNAAIYKCDVIVNMYGAFAPCHYVVTSVPFMNACVFDMCADATNEDLFCADVQAYASRCAFYGVIIDWRDEYTCPIRCPPNSHYELSTSVCANSCSDPDAADSCDERTSACVCDTGYLLSEGQCVLQSQCGCDVDGRYYELGTVWFTGAEGCDTRCECVSTQNAVCTDISSCPPDTACVLQASGVYACVCTAGSDRLPTDCDQIVCPVTPEEDCRLAQNGEICPSEGNGHALTLTDTKYTLAERGDKTDQCWTRVIVRTNENGGVYWAAVNGGVHPGAGKNKEERSYTFNLWGVAGVKRRGYQISDPEPVTVFPETWDNGELYFTIIETTAGGHRLTATCGPEADLVLVFEWGKQDPSDIDIYVGSTVGWSGECYAPLP